jgi:hypothetical protein
MPYRKGDFMFSKTLYRLIAILMSCLVLVLTACTGTQADAEPLFLIAGVQDDGGANPRVVVVQDRILDGIADGEERFVTFASLGLEATARAFDLVDEIGTREELVVLSRSQEGDTVTAFLEFFNTRGLLASDTATFRSSRDSIDLGTFDIPDLCPVDLEVTREGNHALLFNSPRVCDSTQLDTDNTIVALSIFRNDAPFVLSSLEEGNLTRPLITSNVLTSTPFPTGMFLDQSTNTLYYLRERGTQNINLQSLSFSAYTSESPETGANSAQVILDNLRFQVDSFRDMTKVGSSLAILGTTNYVLGPLNPTTTLPEPIDTLDARSQTPRAFVPDATASSLFILDSNDKLVYHADPTLPANTEADVTGTLSALNTDSDFLYVLGINSRDEPLVTIFDLQPLFSEGNTNLESLFTEESCDGEDDGLCDLTNPTALTWAEGILLPTDEAR